MERDRAAAASAARLDLPRKEIQSKYHLHIRTETRRSPAGFQLSVDGRYALFSYRRAVVSYSCRSEYLI